MFTRWLRLSELSLFLQSPSIFCPINTQQCRTCWSESLSCLAFALWMDFPLRSLEFLGKNAQTCRTREMRRIEGWSLPRTQLTSSTVLRWWVTRWSLVERLPGPTLAVSVRRNLYGHFTGLQMNWNTFKTYSLDQLLPHWTISLMNSENIFSSILWSYC